MARTTALSTLLALGLATGSLALAAPADAARNGGCYYFQNGDKWGSSKRVGGEGTWVYEKSYATRHRANFVVCTHQKDGRYQGDAYTLTGARGQYVRLTVAGTTLDRQPSKNNRHYGPVRAAIGNRGSATACVTFWSPENEGGGDIIRAGCGPKQKKV